MGVVAVRLTRLPSARYAASVTKPTLVTLVDYGGGNIRSVVRALTHVGARVRVTDDPAVVAASDRIALPGQGAFDECMGQLHARGLADAIQSQLAHQRPCLGIFQGDVVQFQPHPSRKVPHMGWNTVVTQENMRCLPTATDERWFYFVHSYYVPTSIQTSNPAALCATTEYGQSFVSAIEQDHIFACQFHPEKSQAAGLTLLERFVQ